MMTAGRSEVPPRNEVPLEQLDRAEASPLDPLQQPGLAYQHAIDWVAAQLAGQGENTAVWGSTLRLTAELWRRQPQIPYLTVLPESWPARVAPWSIAPTALAPAAPGSLAAIAWLEPAVRDLSSLPIVRHWLRPQGELFLVVGGTLGRFLAERKGKKRLARLADHRQAKAWLAAQQFQIVTEIGIHGLTAVGWHLAGVLAGRLNRPAWQDRAHYGMRRAFVLPEGKYKPAALRCIRARKL